MRQEASLVKYGQEIISFSVGPRRTAKDAYASLEVEFDFPKVWAYYQSHKDGFDQDQLRFFHVHPPKCLLYSATDLDCIQGFNLSFGFPVSFSIVCFETEDLQDPLYDIVTYRYIDGTMRVIPGGGGQILSPNEVLMLKTLSQATVN